MEVKKRNCNLPLYSSTKPAGVVVVVDDSSKRGFILDVPIAKLGLSLPDELSLSIGVEGMFDTSGAGAGLWIYCLEIDDGGRDPLCDNGRVD